MRIYGSSPLYNYVELIFRSRRMFIVSILLGTIITSSLVYFRDTMYQATMVVEFAPDSGIGKKVPRGKTSPMARKVSRLVFWMKEDPTFVDSIIKGAALDVKYPALEVDELRKRVRRAFGKPVRTGENYVKLTVRWPDPEEAKAILSNIYSRFANKTVDTETSLITSRRIYLEKRFKAYSEEADAKMKRRMSYLKDHYWQQPSLLTASMVRLNRAEEQIADTQMELNEINSRLAETERRLARTAKYVKGQSSDVITETDPAVELAQRKDGLVAELNSLLQRFAEQHPAVIAKKQEIQSVDEALEKAKKQPPVRQSMQREVRTELNPDWQDLNKLKTGFLVAQQGLSRRLADLQGDVAKYRSRVQAMPSEEVAFRRIDREAKLANNIRDNLAARLTAARINEAQDRDTERSLMKEFVKPDADKVDAKAKTTVLYFLGPILGLVIAFGFSLLAEALDRTLRTPVEAERYLGKPVLAVIPKMHAPKQDRKRLAGGARQSISS